MRAREEQTTRQTAAGPKGTYPSASRSWRRVLHGLVAAAFRVHHYRDLHSRMLRDALDDVDCGSGAAGRNP